MASVDPAPMEDHDPFSLGDSDEELPESTVKKTDAAASKGADSATKTPVAESEVKPSDTK
jgi:hypothetical protein